MAHSAYPVVLSTRREPELCARVRGSCSLRVVCSKPPPLTPRTLSHFSAPITLPPIAQDEPAANCSRALRVQPMWCYSVHLQAMPALCKLFRGARGNLNTAGFGSTELRERHPDSPENSGPPGHRDQRRSALLCDLLQRRSRGRSSCIQFVPRLRRAEADEYASETSGR